MNTRTIYDSTFGEGGFELLFNSSGHIMVDANGDAPTLTMRTGTEIRFSTFFDVVDMADTGLEVIELDIGLSPFFSIVGDFAGRKTVGKSFQKGILEAARVAAERFLSEHPEEYWKARIQGEKVTIDHAQRKAADLASQASDEEYRANCARKRLGDHQESLAILRRTQNEVH